MRVLSLDLNTERVSQLMTKAGREFQVVGAAQLNDRLPMAVRLKGTWSSGTSDDLSDRVTSACSDVLTEVRRC